MVKHYSCNTQLPTSGISKLGPDPIVQKEINRWSPVALVRPVRSIVLDTLFTLNRQRWIRDLQNEATLESSGEAQHASQRIYRNSKNKNNTSVCFLKISDLLPNNFQKDYFSVCQRKKHDSVWKPHCCLPSYRVIVNNQMFAVIWGIFKYCDSAFYAAQKQTRISRGKSSCGSAFFLFWEVHRVCSGW